MRCVRKSSSRNCRKYKCRGFLPQEREKKKIPPSLFIPTPSLFSLCGFMRWNEATVILEKFCRKPHQEIMKGPFRNIKLHEVKDEHCIVRATHLCSRGLRIPTSRMSQHPQGRWCRPQPVLPLEEQQTYLKIENSKLDTQKIVLRT